MSDTPHTEVCSDYGCLIVRCDCGRQQSDIGQESLELVGWRIVDAAWKCPFCTGNTGNLKKVFDGRGLS